MSFSAVGQVFDRQAFREHLKSQDLTWARGVTIHHTAFPDLGMRPKGFTIQHMRNIQWGYINERGWDRGPHLFVDEDQVFGMSPLNERSIHAVKFNAHFISMELLGDFDYEDDPAAGRGAEVMTTAAVTAAQILYALGKTPSDDSVTFHREDPRTSKTCPGKKVDKAWFLDKVRKAYDEESSFHRAVDDREGKSEAPVDGGSLLSALRGLWETIGAFLKKHE